MNEQLDLLPHGPEFKFINEIKELEAGVSAIGTYQITGEEGFLKGHFPEQPLWPGVIMLEAIAQLGGVVAQSDPAERKLENMRLTAVKNAKILGSVAPPCELTVTAKVEGRMGTLIQVSGSVLAGEAVLAKAKVVLSGD